MSGVEQYGGGGAISDEAFGPSWNGDTRRGASRNSLYDFLITIGAGFGNTAFVRSSGNDTTGVVGNYLLPFATPGAAIAALGTLPSSALAIDAGTYIVTDANAPFGLKAPGSKYDIYCAVGCRIEYYGTYGMYCSDGNDGSTGRIFGNGDFVNYSTSATKIVNGKSGYTFNCALVPGSNIYEFNQILNEVTTGSVGLMRVGNNSSTGSVTIDLKTRSYSRTAITLYADTGSRLIVKGAGTYDSVGDFLGGANYTIRVEEPTVFTMENTRCSARGQAFGNANTKCIVIRNTSNALIKFINVDATCIEAPLGYKLIDFEAVTPLMDNLLFKNCSFRNRQSTAFASSGASFDTASNISFKIIDTYVEKNTGGAGVITNLISTGNGLMVEPNIV